MFLFLFFIRDVHFRIEGGTVGFFPFSAGIIIPNIILVGDKSKKSGTDFTIDDAGASGAVPSTVGGIVRYLDETVKVLHCSFAIYHNTNDASASTSSTATTSIGAPDLLPCKVKRARKRTCYFLLNQIKLFLI